MVRSPMSRRQDEAPLTPPENKTERELHSVQRESFSLNRISFGGHHHSEIPQNDPDYYPADAGDRSLFREANCPPCDCDCTSDGLTGCLRRNRQIAFTVMILSVSTIIILLIFRSLSYDHRGRYVEDLREQTSWEFHHHHHHYNETGGPDSGVKDEDYAHERISVPVIVDSREPEYYIPYPHAISLWKLRQEAQANFLKRRRKRDANGEHRRKNVRDMILRQKSKYEDVLAQLNDIEKSMMEYKNHFWDHPRTVFEPFSLTNPTTASWTEIVDSPENFIDHGDEDGNLKLEVTDNMDKWGETVRIIPTETVHDFVTPRHDNTAIYTGEPGMDYADVSNVLDATVKGVIATGSVTETTESALSTYHADYDVEDAAAESVIQKIQINTESYQTETSSEPSTVTGLFDGSDEIKSDGEFTDLKVEDKTDGTITDDLAKPKLTKVVLETTLKVSESSSTSSTTEDQITTKYYDTETGSVTDGNVDQGESEKAKNFHGVKDFFDDFLPELNSPYPGKFGSLGVAEPVPEQSEKDRTVGISLAEAKKKKLHDRKHLLLNSRIVSGASDILFPTAPDETKSVLNTDESFNTSQQLSMTPSAFAQYFFPYQMCFYANSPNHGKASSRKSSPRTFKIEAPSFFHIPDNFADSKKQASYHFPTQQNFLSFNINNYANHGQSSSSFPPSAGSTYVLPSPQHFVPFLSGARQPQQQPLFCTYIQPPLLQFPPSSGASEFIHPKCVDCEDDLPTSREVNFVSAKDVGCLDNMVSCRDGSACIPAMNWCDNRVHCKDGSDEVYCSCRERLAFDRLCDGYLDCPNGEDELGCFGCPKGTFSCDTYDEPRACIPISKRCDDFPDCPSGKDEMDCTALFPEIRNNNSYHVSYGKGFLHRNWRGEWFPVCVEFDSNFWATTACMEELGPVSGVPQISLAEVSHTYKGPFIVKTKNNEIEVQEHCKGHVSTYVKCPEVQCGTRIVSEDYAETRFKRYIQSEGKSFHRWWKRAKKEIMAKYQVDDVYWKLAPVEDAVGGKNTKREETGRVVGGKESEPRAWPWVVALYRNGEFHCGGVILDEKWVLTAAHCVENYHKDYYEIRSGMLRRFSYSPMEQVRRVSDVVVHEKYNKAIMNNDVALLRLHKPLNFNRWVRPACLPSFREGDFWGPLPGTRCIAIGWGAVKEHGSNPDQMREVEVPILSKCKHVEDLEGEEICAGVAEGGKDTCQGDSGGPLLCRDSKSSWYVAGIVSHGEGCARPNEPGAYTRVSLFMDWITANSNDFQLPIKKPLTACPGLRCTSGSKRCISRQWVCNGVTDCVNGEDELNCHKPSFSLGRSMEDKVLSGTLQQKKDVDSFLFDEIAREKKNGSSQAPVVRSLNKVAEVTSYIVKALEVYGDRFYFNKSRSFGNYHQKKTEADEKVTESPDELHTAKNSTALGQSVEILPIIGNVSKAEIAQERKHDSFSAEKSYNIEHKEGNNDSSALQLKSDEVVSTEAAEFTRRPVSHYEKLEYYGDKDKDKVNAHEDGEDASHLISKETEETDYETFYGERPSDETEKEQENAVGYVRGYIHWNDSLPSAFQCRNIIQTVKSLYHCDGITDCEDATDETLCTCRDRLMKTKPEFICNGVSDCEDLTDEMYCHSCSKKEFNCMRSRQCLPKFKRCDDVKDCHYGEDEEGCFALAKDGRMRLGKDGKPLLRFSGTVMSKKGDVWHPFCQDDNDLRTAVRACYSIGSSGYDNYENGTSSTPNCTTLDLTCSRRLTNDLSYYDSYANGYRWPWLAFIYSDGKKLCTAALLENEWLMTGVHCAEHFSLRRNHVVAKLGSGGRDSDDIVEFGTQIIRVDGTRRVHNSEIILLHLSKHARVTWRVRPMSLPFWFDVSNSKGFCIALGEETVYLRSLPSVGSYRCFAKIGDLDNCKITHRHKPWTGVIVCQSQIGWYPASVFHERKGFCDSDRFYYFNVLERIKDIKSAIEHGVRSSPELKCDGIRCREGRCIQKKKICDGTADCPAGEDESFDVCFGGKHKKKGCKMNEITCKNGACIAKNLFANGHDDCGDGSDEPESATCYEYLKLASPERICDGMVNCFDKSDERPDICPCAANKFNCSLSETACVPFDFVCDGARDCPEGEDEAECVGYKRQHVEANKNEIEVIHMSYGIWHSLCSPSISEEQANAICKELGYEAALDMYKKNQTRISPALDAFTTVKLNSRTSVLLRSDRPFATAEENGYCEVVRVICQ